MNVSNSLATDPTRAPFTSRAFLFVATLTQAAVLVPLVRISLWLLPARVVFGQVTRSSARFHDAAQARRPPVRRIARAITTVSRVVPRATCLTQALAAQVLLARYGYASRLEIGVSGQETRKFRAHAWVTCEGRIVVGNGDLKDFHRFDRLSEALSTMNADPPAQNHAALSHHGRCSSAT